MSKVSGASKVERTGMPVALIVDDEESICTSLAGVLSDEGWRTVTANSGKEGIYRFLSDPPDIVLLDVWMPGMDGIEVLQNLRDLRDDIPVVIMSGHGNIETAVKATKLGAFDFLEKPLSLEKLLPMIGHARDLRISRELKPGGPEKASRHELVGISASTEAIRKQIKVVAPRNSWVLITGENGTGKEVVARNIHLSSSRATKPFIEVNCAAIPEELIESELFGHIKGAFTNAVATRRGKFELANEGTIFLDEIGDMSLKTQAKILRILQERRLERLGDTETIEVDVRVIAATNKDLSAEIKAGSFREDLFYRLNVIPFKLPPLRERREDVPLLANFFLDRMAKELMEPRKKIDDDALAALQRHPWPGNVRELKNLIERLCILVELPNIRLEDLPEAISGLSGPGDAANLNFGAVSLKQAKGEFERAFILDKLQEHQWNVSRTADAIGIERSNLHRKLRSYHIDPKQLKG